MEFGDFPYFAVWSPYKDFDVPFTCLEPWSTLPDGTHLDHAIENKQGICRLAPGESETPRIPDHDYRIRRCNEKRHPKGCLSLSIKLIFMQERQPRGSAHSKAFAQ